MDVEITGDEDGCRVDGWGDIEEDLISDEVEEASIPAYKMEQYIFEGEKYYDSYIIYTIDT